MKSFGVKYFKHKSGFSLLEMLMVIALIAITCHFVLGNYQTFTVRNHREVAELTLLQIAAALEDYAAENLTYTGATLATLKIRTTQIEKYYMFQIKSLEPDYFLLTATPASSQAANDRCGVLELDSFDRKSTSTHAPNCW